MPPTVPCFNPDYAVSQQQPTFGSIYTTPLGDPSRNLFRARSFYLSIPDMRAACANGRKLIEAGLVALVEY